MHLSVQRSRSRGTPAVLRWIRNDDGCICYLWRTSLCVHALPVQLPLCFTLQCAADTQEYEMAPHKWDRRVPTALVAGHAPKPFKMRKINSMFEHIRGRELRRAHAQIQDKYKRVLALASLHFLIARRLSVASSVPHNRTSSLCLYECQTQAKCGSFYFQLWASQKDFTIDFSFIWAEASAESGQRFHGLCSIQAWNSIWTLDKLLTYVWLAEHPLEMRGDRGAKRGCQVFENSIHMKDYM